MVANLIGLKLYYGWYIFLFVVIVKLLIIPSTIKICIAFVNELKGYSRHVCSNYL